MEETCSINQIANWFLSKSSMSPKKLQKLLYYSYSWSLVYFNDPESDDFIKLFNEDFEAWVHGPVNREIYRKYKDYGYNDIPKRSKKEKVPKDVKSLLNDVWERYGEFTADELERLTHSEKPWKKARKGLGLLDASNAKIDDKVVYKYYFKLMERNGI